MIAKFDEIVKISMISGCTQLIVAPAKGVMIWYTARNGSRTHLDAITSWVQPPILTISSNLAIIAKLGDPKCL